MHYGDLIDLKHYPVDTSSTVLQEKIAEARRGLRQDGCAVLRGFLSEAGVVEMKREADANASHARQTFNRTNVYFTEDDISLPKTHPKRRFFDRSNAFVPADNFGASGALRTVFNAPGFDAFVQHCLEERAFFRYADPLADAIVNVAKEGPGFP
ncbi:MAG: hypothetical protein AAF665_03970, partial [Pseudomonadota bacterium]